MLEAREDQNRERPAVCVFKLLLPNESARGQSLKGVCLPSRVRKDA